MVQSAENRRGDQLGGPGDRSISLRLRNRRVAIQALMGPGDMVVLSDELPQQSLQVALAQDDHMVQKLSAKGAPESFDERILPRRPVRNPHLLDAAGVQELPHPAAIDAVVIEEEISRLLAVRHGFTVVGCINWAAVCQGAQNLDRTTHSSRKPAVNLNLGEPFCSVRRLHMPNWLSAATSLAARDARVWKNALTKRRR